MHFRCSQSKPESRYIGLAGTPVRLSAMVVFLRNYSDRIAASNLSHGFSNGFPLHYEGPIKSCDAKYLQSASNNVLIVRDKIRKDIQAGRVQGPYQYPPFKHFRVSPIGLVLNKPFISKGRFC